MSVGRTPEQARKDQRQRDRDNLELRNQSRSERGLRPLTMREYLDNISRRPRTARERGWGSR